MPVQKYEVELSDGRKFIVETEGGPPSEQDVLASLSSQAAPAEAAPTSSGIPSVDYLSRASGPFVKSAAQGALDVVNPMAYYRTVKGLLGLAGRAAKAGANPISLGAEFGPDVVAGVEGLKETASTPEGMGSMAGAATIAALTSRIPVGGALGRIGKYGRETKAGNVIRAVGESNAAKKQVIEKLVNSGELELPVSASAKSLQAKVAKQVDAAGTELDTAKAGLKGLPEASVQDAVAELKAQRPEVKGATTTTTVQPRTPAGLTSQKPAPVTTTVTETGTGNKALLSAMDTRLDELLKLAGADQKLKPEAIQALKEQFQASASGAYKVASGTGAESAAGAEASEAFAKALRETMENSPDIPKAVRDRLTSANRETSKLLSVAQPLEAQRVAHLGGNVISRSIAGLLGRGLAGGGTSALGAAGGVEIGAQFQNVLFNTLSAAGKAKVAPFLESGDLQGAVQAAFAAHIAENAARRGQEPTQ